MKFALIILTVIYSVLSYKKKALEDKLLHPNETELVFFHPLVLEIQAKFVIKFSKPMEEYSVRRSLIDFLDDHMNYNGERRMLNKIIIEFFKTQNI